MKSQGPTSAIMFTLACLVGSGWALAHVTSAHHRQTASIQSMEDGAPLRVAAVLVSGDAVPIHNPFLELEVPLNSYVRKGQVIGESPEGETTNPSVDAEAHRRLADADAAEAAARGQLRIAEAAIAAARTGANDQEFPMVTAEAATLRAEDAAQSSDRGYRQGLVSEVEHDRAVELHRTALEEVDAQHAPASISVGAVDDLEAIRLEAQSVLRDAVERRRSLEAAVRSPGPRAIAVVAPADGFLVASDAYNRTFEIVSDLQRRVEARVSQNEIGLIRVGQLATISVAGQTGTLLHAVVDSIGPPQSEAPGVVVLPVTLAVTDAGGFRPDHASVMVTFEQTPRAAVR